MATVPKTLGACADRLMKIREAISELNKEVDALKEEKNAIENHLIDNLPKSDAQGVLGKVARAAIVKKKVASVTDWDALYKHILKTKSFDLMQRRVSDTAVRERWEDGKVVPGVEPFDAITVSVTKL